VKHYSEDDLILYYYGECRKRGDATKDTIARHLAGCGTCSATYRDIAGTLAMVGTPDAPERGEQYGLEVWQRIRHQLPEQEGAWWDLGRFFRYDRLALVGAAAALAIVAFVAGRWWPSTPPGGPAGAPQVQTASAAAPGDLRQRVLLTSVADHLDRSERMLTDVMNSAARTDISTEQRWAEDLLTTSRLYRQDALDIGEQSVAAVLDDLERSLLEIVHSPSPISAAELDQIRRRIDAAALLFKVRVLSDELRQREGGAAPGDGDAAPRTQGSTRKTS
jgi:hypothetical protein